jgi:hypothetical protein
MKRINSETNTQAGPFPVTGFDPALLQVPLVFVTRAIPIRTQPYTPAEVEARTLALAAGRERQTGNFDVRLGKPKPEVYELAEQRPSFLQLPEDVFKQIIPRLEKRSVAAVAATCRIAYLHVDTLLPGRRLPGLLADLQQLRVRNFKIRPESFNAFLGAIAVGGRYDRIAYPIGARVKIGARGGNASMCGCRNGKSPGPSSHG